jgi:AhpD family alkylhydroperoxidase
MKSPAQLIPGLLPSVLAVSGAASKCGLPAKTRYLVLLRVSQINGCGFCVDMHARDARKHGETEQRLHAVAVWRDTPYFEPSERAALALAEAATRIADRSDPVPDDIWAEAERHFDEPQLAALLVDIAMINFWNRLNVPIRQVAGTPIA